MTLFSLLISFVNRELVRAVDSIRQPWLNFQRWFLVLLWLIVCLTIPCVKHESIFAIGFMRRSWIRWRCRIHTSAVTHTSVAISRSKVTLFSLTISGLYWRSFHWRPWFKFQTWFLVLLWLIVCLTIPCLKHESIFAIGFMRCLWIRWRCRLHKSAVTHISVAISRSTVTLF